MKNGQNISLDGFALAGIIGAGICVAALYFKKEIDDALRQGIKKAEKYVSGLRKK
jgi:hypothetical protein